MALATGSVFGEIILYQIYTESELSSKQIMCFTAHQGPVFSISLFEEYIASTGDDRSLVVFKIDSGRADVVFRRFEHKSRIWKCLVFKKDEKLFFVSGGEDASLVFYDLNGDVLNKFSVHNGLNIFSLCLDPKNELVFSGGADGAILTSVIETRKKEEQIETVALSDDTGKEVVTNIVSTVHKKFVVTTSKGNIFLVEQCNDGAEILQLENFEGCSHFAKVLFALVSKCKNVIFILELQEETLLFLIYMME
eukprot:snap_masked-scaffold_2-processed-gene-3.3-mRNA-1 protein AED:1.00 eAED:1.00 QI:0/0/0/0/1/1/2/0/250